eukprot:scaffold4538_cov410-Prasinococcus_capsulatus_cf.AAC.5
MTRMWRLPFAGLKSLLAAPRSLSLDLFIPLQSWQWGLGCCEHRAPPARCSVCRGRGSRGASAHTPLPRVWAGRSTTALIPCPTSA